MRSLLIVCSKSDEAFPGILIEGSGLYQFFDFLLTFLSPQCFMILLMANMDNMKSYKTPVKIVMIRVPKRTKNCLPKCRKFAGRYLRIKPQKNLNL